MKVGTLAYCTDQGLGNLARSFYQAGVVTDVLVVSHSSRTNHYNWYPGSQITALRPFDLRKARNFCKSVDLMLFFETPFDWSLIEYCKSIGVKTVVMPMYECMPKQTPEPDLWLCPSLLDFQYYPRGTFLPVPVEDHWEWKLRTEAKVFVHNAGHGGLKGRNGTAEVVEAMRYVKSPAKLIIRCQNPTNFPPYSELLGKATLEIGTIPPTELYSTGDVFLFPEKFNGLSLPLQEAFASGMAVMCGDRYPMSTWLPQSPLIPVRAYRRQSVSSRCLEFDEAQFDPITIAQTIDEWYGLPIDYLSLKGKQWKEENSWARLKPKYQEVLEGVLG